MSFCCVPDCKIYKKKCSKHFSFFKVPRREELRNKWLENIKQDSIKVTNTSHICSRHFTENCFKYKKNDKGDERRYLIKGAVPTIFAWNDWGDSVEQNSQPDTLNQEISKVKENINPHDELTNSDETVQYFLPSKLELLSRINELENNIKCKDEEINKLKVDPFGVERFSYDDSKILYYTGFPDIKTFKTVFAYLSPSAQNMRSCYYKNECNDPPVCKKFRTSMILIDEFFMFCVRVRLGLQVEDLSDRFLVSKSTISRLFITWSNFLYFVLGSINIWLSRSEINELMPSIFKKKFPSTRVIIDCTELKTQVPSSLVRNSQMYSHYKGMCTVKCLVGIAPHGPVIFVSQLYTGNCSDVHIFKNCGILDLLQPGDSVMADKGFVVEKLLKEKGVSLNIPHFLSKSVQFSKQEVLENKDISSCRIHIERSIRRIKENLFFENIPLTVCGTLNQTWTSAVLLTLFKKPLVQSFLDDLVRT